MLIREGSALVDELVAQAPSLGEAAQELRDAQEASIKAKIALQVEGKEVPPEKRAL